MSDLTPVKIPVVHREWAWLAGPPLTVLAALAVAGAMSWWSGTVGGAVAWLMIWGLGTAGTVAARLGWIGASREMVTIDGHQRTLRHGTDDHDLGDAGSVEVVHGWTTRATVVVRSRAGHILATVPDLRRSQADLVALELAGQLRISATGLDRAGEGNRVVGRAHVDQGLSEAATTTWCLPPRIVLVALSIPLLSISNLLWLAPAVLGAAPTQLSALVLATLAISAWLAFPLSLARPRRVRLQVARRGLTATVTPFPGLRTTVTIPSHQLRPPRIVSRGWNFELVLYLTGTEGQLVEVAGRPRRELEHIADWVQQARRLVRALPAPVDEPPEALQHLRALAGQRPES